MKMLLLVTSSVVALPIFASFLLNEDGEGIYRMRLMYEAEPVSFSPLCKMSDISVEKRLIYERRVNVTNNICAVRAESALRIKPVGVFMRRSRFDGSYVVGMQFDKESSIKIEKVFQQGKHEVVLHRGDTLLTTLVSDSGRFYGEVEVYFDTKLDADEAMNQVTSLAKQQAVRSWR